VKNSLMTSLRRLEFHIRFLIEHSLFL